ncbi:DinB family protein [Mesobacillus subterraneus]|uniref:DinB family protein n=1 Tax=Mesobacillus subterraneus TaxID=285983 RepID=UPI00203C5272|nr:DinB family protein [Mesobacillus subterraneus]MCM3663229.1 DinB family protein [Mesobacillus subterraneus]MCM3682598.1 DinB family protein [Mesobacillus subterraneus]
MNIEQMKQHYTEFDIWVNSLREVTDTEWQMPLGEGKWSVAAVVAHLLFWDKYSLEERFPYFKEGAELPSYPDFQGINDRAREYAEKTATKEDVLDELLAVRKEYLKMLEQMDSEKLAVSFKISNHQLTIGKYFEDFIQHDIHHQMQVNQTLGKALV